MLLPNSITTKLMAIVVVIAAGYALLIGLFLFTLNHIKAYRGHSIGPECSAPHRECESWEENLYIFCQIPIMLHFILQER